MKEIYEWVPWFTELAHRIADGGPKYLSDRAKKVEWRHDQNLQGLLNYGDENIDPFSFFYTVASKGAHYASRKTTYPSISRVFELQELADHDSEYTFIFPTPNPINLLFHYKGAGNPELLWRLFRQASNGVESIIDHDFDSALNMKSIAIVKLTQVLFLVNPHEFLPLDEKLHPLKVTEWAKKPRWAEYRNTLAKFRQSFPRCAPYEINLFAWLVFDKELNLGAPNYYQIVTKTDFNTKGTLVRQHQDEVWKDFRFGNCVYTASHDDEDRAIFAAELQKAAPGDVVLVRAGRNDGRGIGVVQKNDYRDDPNGKIHVLWLNTVSANLPGNVRTSAFSRAREKSLDAFRAAEEYAPTFDLLARLETGSMEKDSANDSGQKSLTRRAVLRAIEEFNQLGRDAFLRKYGRRGSDSYWIKHRGNHYDLKAIWGAAHVHAGMQQPHRNLGTGQNSIQVKAQLERLGFTVVHKSDRKGAVDHAKNRILYGPPGTGKTWSTVRHSLAIIDGVKVGHAEDDRERFWTLRFDPDSGNGQIAMVTFHQNFAYEDFVEGIRPKLDGEDLSYELHDGIFKRIAHAAAESSDKAFVLIIDEINRGNIAKIFGELITLIEDSRRVGEEDETEVTLPYSVEPFSIPDNLYIIGTMNTADRSIQLLDTALRRRFTFFEMMPNPEHDLVPPDVEGVDCRRMLKAINERITVLLDREHQIGHTYFKEVDDIEQLANAFRNQIFPLLQEYFFDDWGKIHRVLNGNGFVSTRNAASLLPADERSDEDTTIYERLRHNDAKWSDPEEYKVIYASANASEA